MQTQQQTDKQPASISTAMFIVTVIALAFMSLLIVTLPLTIPGFIYVVNLRKQHAAMHEQLQTVMGQYHQATNHISQLQLDLQTTRTRFDQVSKEHEDLRHTFTQIDDMNFLQRHEEAQRLDGAIATKKTEIEKLLQQKQADLATFEKRKQAILDDIASERQKRAELKEIVVDLEEMVNLNDYGLYNFENPAADSVHYADELKRVKTKIKGMVKDKTATTASTSWTVNNSVSQGRKMVNDMSRLLLRAFNAEAENSVKTVRAGHLSTAIKRLHRSSEAIARMGKMMDLRIHSDYVRLREEELRITHAHLEAKKTAKELEREERARERDERRAQKELAAAKAKQVKEVEHYRTLLKTLQSSEDAQAIANASADLTAAEEKLSDVESTMANTRAGYVYVISNRGAFGPDIIKIGMTRRLNPAERVRELGDASVPFYFDSHTTIFAKDAVGLERALHRHFASVRVNLINLRREYFYATPAEVREALVHLHGDYEAQLLEFHETADAPEYVASEDLRSKGTIPQPANLA